MMYMARKCFRKTKKKQKKKKRLVRRNTPNHRKQLRNIPYHLIYLPFHMKPLTLSIFTVDYFVYLLSQVELGIKGQDVCKINK